MIVLYVYTPVQQNNNIFLLISLNPTLVVCRKKSVLSVSLSLAGEDTPETPKRRERSVSFSPGGFWTAFVYVARFDTFRIPAPTQLKNTVPLSGSGWMLNVTPKNARTVRKH